MCTELAKPRLDYWGGKCSEPQSASEHATSTSRQNWVQIQPQPAETGDARQRSHTGSKFTFMKCPFNARQANYTIRHPFFYQGDESERRRSEGLWRRELSSSRYRKEKDFCVVCNQRCGGEAESRGSERYTHRCGYQTTVYCGERFHHQMLGYWQLELAETVCKYLGMHLVRWDSGGSLPAVTIVRLNV